LAPQTLVVVPVTDFEQDILSHIALSPEVELEVNDWGIPEPKIHKNKVSPSQLDMVLVPMLGFDSHLNRLGYGKGHYDHFLAQTRPDCLKIGICFDLGLVEEGIPAEPHDFPLDAVITESAIYRSSL
jgi:5-formyltetrahydrofolate cyclo-ligase